MSAVVTYESKNNIATITINRPEKMNALNDQVGEELLAAWQRLNASDDRVAIVTGAGERAFSVGADLTAPPELWRFMPGVGIDVDKPLIAAVNGWCIGGAVVLVQFCDLCVASGNAKFSYPEAKIGISGGLISALSARIPHKIAMELVMLCEDLSAERAYQAGFVNKITSQEDLMPAALEYAERLAGYAPLVLSMIKRFTGQVLPKGPSEAAGIARRDTEGLIASDDFKEGALSFKEKRPAVFKGK